MLFYIICMLFAARIASPQPPSDDQRPTPDPAVIAAKATAHPLNSSGQDTVVETMHHENQYAVETTLAMWNVFDYHRVGYPPHVNPIRAPKRARGSERHLNSSQPDVFSLWTYAPNEIDLHGVQLDWKVHTLVCPVMLTRCRSTMLPPSCMTPFIITSSTTKSSRRVPSPPKENSGGCSSLSNLY